MVKILNTSSNNNLFFNSEQYNDCSSFLMKADDPPLEELDPAILSCGLPAIVLSDMQQQHHPALVSLRAPKIRYTSGQLQAMRKSALCFRRPVVADDPRIGQFAIWKSANQLKRGCRGSYTARTTTEQKSGGCEGTKEDVKPQEKLQGGIGQQKFQFGRENGFVAPRFRRNYDFNNRNHHVIVKNYRGGGDDHHQHHYRLQDTVIEEEPEWMAAGPTSRLDTIELRGFDEDVVSPNASLEKTSDGGQRKAPGGKHISFYDELHHYEHIVGGAKQRNGGGNTSSGDVESVATSNGSSPPPARSTPTKGVGDSNNNNLDVNVNNFEEFMKFDSILGTDSGPSNNGAQSGSRFSKWFRRGTNGYNQSTGSSFRQAFLSNNDAFGNNRFPQQNHNHHQRHFGPQQSYGNRTFHPSESYDPQQGHFGDDSSSTAFKRLVEMVAQNHASNNLLAQQQYLMQLLNKNQQSEILRRMLMKNAVDNVVTDANQQPHQQQTNQPRIPTQQELQFHTQSIMQNALLRKKLQDQRKMLYEQATEPTANPAVQQFVQSVCPNIQRSLSVLSQTAGANQFPAPSPSSSGNSMFPGGSTSAELSNSLQQMLLSQPQQQGQRHSGAAAGSGRGRFGKGSVTWNLN